MILPLYVWVQPLYDRETTVIILSPHIRLQINDGNITGQSDTCVEAQWIDAARHHAIHHPSGSRRSRLTDTRRSRHVGTKRPCSARCAQPAVQSKKSRVLDRRMACRSLLLQVFLSWSMRLLLAFVPLLLLILILLGCHTRQPSRLPIRVAHDTCTATHRRRENSPEAITTWYMEPCDECWRAGSCRTGL